MSDPGRSPNLELYEDLAAIHQKLCADDASALDDLLDLMDRVAGWCAPDRRIWVALVESDGDEVAIAKNEPAEKSQ